MTDENKPKKALTRDEKDKYALQRVTDKNYKRQDMQDALCRGMELLYEQVKAA